MNSKARYLLSYLALPFIRLEVPGWGQLARLLGVQYGPECDHLWTGLPQQSVRGKWHGYTIPVDLEDWSQRLVWFLGRYYELDTQLVVRALVRPGDTFLDIGANVGMITLLASHHVGRIGKVHSFEPNPVTRANLNKVIAENNIENVEVYDVALSDNVGIQKLTVVGRQDGVGTLAKIPETSKVTTAHNIQTAIGDDIIPENLSGRLFIKIDIEGFEPFALKGLTQTIDKHKPLILTEFRPDHLTRAGSSAEEMVAIMAERNYVPFNISVKRPFYHHKFHMVQSDAKTICPHNVLWVSFDDRQKIFEEAKNSQFYAA